MAHVIPKMISYSSSFNFDSSKGYVSDVTLADPHFNTEKRIEILLGSSVNVSIIEEGIRRGDSNEPIATKTKFGWVLSGNSGIGFNCCSIIIDPETSVLLFNLEKFWKQEELFDPSAVMLNPDEQDCEHFFVKTHSRDPSG